jgi:hypothetical protein
MDTKKAATEYRMIQWTQVLQERAASGESIKRFCERKGISKHTYLYWQKKLREAACNQLVSQQETQNPPVPSGWAVCEATATEPKSGVITVEIGKYRITVSENTNAELLAKTCKVLSPLC